MRRKLRALRPSDLGWCLVVKDRSWSFWAAEALKEALAHRCAPWLASLSRDDIRDARQRSLELDEELELQLLELLELLEPEAKQIPCARYHPLSSFSQALERNFHSAFGHSSQDPSSRSSSHRVVHESASKVIR